MSLSEQYPAARSAKASTLYRRKVSTDNNSVFKIMVNVFILNHGNGLLSSDGPYSINNASLTLLKIKYKQHKTKQPQQKCPVNVDLLRILKEISSY